MKKQFHRYDPESQQNLKLVIAIHRSSLREQRHTQKLLADHDITLPQFGVLETLYHLGPLRVCQLIEKTLSTGGNMTVVIRNLEQQGLVARDQDPEDGRAYRIQLTAAGESLIAELFPKHLESLRALMDGLSPEEKDVLILLLKKFNGIETG